MRRCFLCVCVRAEGANISAACQHIRALPCVMSFGACARPRILSCCRASYTATIQYAQSHTRSITHDTRQAPRYADSGANIFVDGNTDGHIKTNTHPPILLQREAQALRREGVELRSDFGQSRQKQATGCVCARERKGDRKRNPSDFART